MIDVDALARRIAALPRPLLCAFDVDGTLASIVNDPSQAGVPASVVRRLWRLCELPDVAVAIVTGRDAARLPEMIDLPCAWSALEHGRRVVAPGELAPAVVSEDDQRRLARFRVWTERHAIPRGARREEKEGSISVHVRELAARDPDAAIAILDDARAAAREKGLHPRDGRYVIDAELVPADKRAALERIMERTGARACVYAGDDRTDDAAIALAAEHGIGIFMRSAERSEPPPGTTVTIDGPPELWRLLEVLSDYLG